MRILRSFTVSKASETLREVYERSGDVSTLVALLEWAREGGHDVDYDVDLSQATGIGRNMHGHSVAILEVLSSYGVPLDPYCVRYACLHGQEEVVRAIDRLFGVAPSDSSTYGADNDSCLHMACEGGHLGMVRVLIDEYKMCACDEDISGVPAYGYTHNPSRGTSWDSEDLADRREHVRSYLLKL